MASKETGASRHGCGSFSGIGDTLMRQHVGDRSNCEHDESKRGLGRVESVGTIDHETNATIQ